MIELPSRFNEILQSAKDKSFLGAINVTLSKFSEVFSENKLYFFEEYTDHGFRHINSVLQASADLITEDTYPLLTEKDVSILCLGIFLHDLGMHLQPLTFNKMITGGYDEVLNRNFGDERWSSLWETYLSEAIKFNDNQRKSLFGDASVNLGNPPNLNNPDSLTGVDRKLIGEFIRRHHPRIAYEIAFKGLTTHSRGQIDFCADFNKDIKILSGVLARSHGMNIRDAFRVLEDHYSRSWKKPLGVHIIYLMALLRLADYFQIDSKRILKIPYQTKLFRSPVSLHEHNKHLQITNMQELLDDPETLFITAEPPDSACFIALESLFNNIQFELDQSWAILGEIYGRHQYNQQPKLKFRRIRSNIDDKELFASKVSYVPETISFTVDKEILKLLVGPLYGNHPTFGVRELLQNSVDACIEREFIERKMGNNYNGEILIKIEVENGKHFFIIEDNGCGMTLNEIKNLFLKVGGTFRESPKWHDFTDAEGQANINRSGRFGIGILAAYLLGEKIEVLSKSMSSMNSYGYYFNTSLNQEHIEIVKQPLTIKGTIIKISISEKTLQALATNTAFTNRVIPFHKWYTLTSPKIIYNLPDSKSLLALETKSQIDAFGEVGYKNYLPAYNDHFGENWHEIKSNDYKKVQWTYSHEYSQALFSRVICNGIVIPRAYSLDNLRAPILSVFDSEAKLPISLNREFITSQLPFEKELKKDIYKDIIAKLLLTDVVNIFYSNTTIQYKYQNFHHPAITGHSNEMINNLQTLVFHKNGYTLNHSAFLNRLKSGYYARVLTNMSRIVKSNINFDVKNIDLVSMTLTRYVHEESTHNITNRFKGHKIIGINGNFPRISEWVNTNTHILIQTTSSSIPHSNLVMLCEEIIEQPNVPNIMLDEVIFEYLKDDPLIPYDIKERKNKFPDAFRRLSRYMEKYYDVI